MRLTEGNGGAGGYKHLYETKIFQRDEKPYHVSANILQGTHTCTTDPLQTTENR